MMRRKDIPEIPNEYPAEDLMDAALD